MDINIYGHFKGHYLSSVSKPIFLNRLCEASSAVIVHSLKVNITILKALL